MSDFSAQPEVKTAWTNTEVQRLLSLALKYSLLFSLLGTIAAILSNVIIFSVWGLNFSSFASPSDILIGGIAAFVASIPLIFSMGVFWTISFVLNRINIDTVGALVLLSLRMALSLVVLGMLGYIFLEFRGGVFSASFSDNENFGLFGWVVLFSSASCGIYLFLALERHNNLSLLLPLALLISFLSLILSIAYVGFAGQTNLVILDSDQCADFEHVVWMGAANVVTSCKHAPYGSDSDYLVRDRENLVLKSHP